MRDKEKRQDYRYMPEPNLPPLILYSRLNRAPVDIDPISIIDVDEIRSKLPPLPEDWRVKFVREKNVQIKNLLHIEVDFIDFQVEIDFFIIFDIE